MYQCVYCSSQLNGKAMIKNRNAYFIYLFRKSKVRINFDALDFLQAKQTLAKNNYTIVKIMYSSDLNVFGENELRQENKMPRDLEIFKVFVLSF